MAFRLPTLCRCLRQPALNPRVTQRRWAQVQDVRFHATHDTQARILAKYKAKLEEKAKAQGLRDLEELKEQYKDKIQELRNKAIAPGATGPLTPQSSPGSPTQPLPSSPQPPSPWPIPPPPPSASTSNHSKPPPGIKTLHSFLDLTKIQALPNKEIQTLWRLRHAQNPQSIHFSLPTSTFDTLLHTAKSHPAFVLPLPRELEPPSPETSETPAPKESNHGAELHYLQFTHPHVDTTTLLFTSLAEFKLRGEFASPHTTITFHQELARSHGLVLGQGLVVEDRGVSVDDARWLVMCMQKFYVQGDQGEGRRKLLEMFTKGDGGFKVERLMEEAERVL